MKKITSLVIALAVILSVAIAIPNVHAQGKFKDVSDSHWATNEIDYLSSKKIVGGFPDGTFKPNTSITRLQAVFMLLRAKEITDLSNISNPQFADMNTKSYGYAEVAKSVQLGIIGGKVNSKGQKVFDPNGKLTRSEMAKILSLGYNLTGTSSVSFKDVQKNHWAYAHIQALAKNGITAGYENGRFGANDFITRAEFSVMMARTLYEKFRVDNSKPSPPPTPSEPEKPSTNGKVYPDGWVAPVLKSAWSSNPSVNKATLQKELGFTDNGTAYNIPGYPDAINVIGQSPSSPSEVDISFNIWQDSAIASSYRVPIVAKELFKLYFGGDANRVWNYLNTGSIPDDFTANGRKVHASLSGSGLHLDVGRKK